LIEAPPGSWQDLEARAAQILRECGFAVEVQKDLPMARGNVKVDLYAIEHTSPPNIIVVECKHWATPATKSVVHAFRTVVADSGANTGLIISSAGFQEGAVEAAAYSNLRLLNWTAFQETFVERWYRRHMALRLREEAEPLFEYMVPRRVFRKASRLSDEHRQQYKALREKHHALARRLLQLLHPEILGETDGPEIPNLPLRADTSAEFVTQLSDDVLDAPALRPLLTALTDSYRKAIAEFDAVFGERA
jgi:restriction system protein